MVRLDAALDAWRTPRFAQILRDAIIALPKGSLPLEQGVSQGGFVDDSDLAISVFGGGEQPDAIHINIGAHFTEIVASCGCGDEPMSVNAYCEMRVFIDKVSAAASFTVSDS